MADTILGIEKSTIFGKLSQLLGADLTSNLFDMTGNFITSIAPIFAIMFGIYLLLIALSYWQSGGIDEMLVDFMKKIMSWSLIIGFAFSATHYFELANWIYKLPDDIAQVFSAKNFNASALDGLVYNMDKLQSKIEDYRHHVSSIDIAGHILYVFVEFCISILNMFILALTFAYYMLTKIALSMTLMIGPLFIGFLLFPATRQWGINWIAQCLNYTLVIVLFVILGSIQQQFFADEIQAAAQLDFDNVTILIGLLPVFTIATIIFALVALNIRSIVSALLGGASLSSMLRTVMSLARAIPTTAGVSSLKSATQNSITKSVSSKNKE